MKSIMEVLIHIIFSNITTDTATYITERYGNIIKPPDDGRSYRSFKLSNDLKVLLISDPLAAVSAACMVVGVGESLP